MKIRFLGVGEAWDPRHKTSSVLVDDGKTSLMIDCGFGVNSVMALILEEEKKDFNYLDGIYITHCHADHQLGVLGLLAIMSKFDHNPAMDPRKKPIIIMGPEGTERSIRSFIEERHPGLFEKMGFEVNFSEVRSGEERTFGSFSLSFAETTHGEEIKNMAIRVASGAASVAYSGDGAVTEGSKKLYDGVNLLIHEAYSLAIEKALHHGVMKYLFDLLEQIKVDKMALIHINRYERQDKKNILDAISERGFSKKIFMPEEGDEININ
jgi:ribonuclease BN (tRNA processing enzyme)